jgi:hypothetical protein
MNPLLMSDVQGSISYFTTVTLTQFMVFVPRLVAAFVMFLLGVAIAKVFKRVVVKVLETLTLSKMLKNTPVEHFLATSDVSQKAEEVVGSIVYWLVMLVVIQTIVTILGLESISVVLDKIIEYIPHIFSAILILFVGLLMAGVIESIVKGAIKTIDGHASRLLGKISSYLVITISLLAAISELGIARDFIMVLFIGFVAALSLGFGLALGLGGQELVRRLLGSWYDRTIEE